MWLVKSVPKDQGSEIIVPHRLMIFYSLDKGKEREKQKGILLHHAETILIVDYLLLYI